MKNQIKALSILVVLIASVASASSKVSFPGPSKEAPDPTGKYVVVWSDSKPHELFVKDLKDQNILPLLAFDRHVDVLWSINGKLLAITDWGGSDYSNVFIYFPNKSKTPVDLKTAFKNALGELVEIEKNHHVYFEALEWNDQELLKFKIHGYGDYNPNGFEKVFEYNSANGKIKQKQ